MIFRRQPSQQCLEGGNAVCIHGFDKIAAYCDGRFYECHDLPRRLRESVIYWINADRRSLKCDSVDACAGKGVAFECVHLFPDNEIMFRNRCDLVFAIGEKTTPEFHALLQELRDHVVTDANRVSAVPQWLDDYYIEYAAEGFLGK